MKRRLEEGMQMVVRSAELKRRGLRFLPAQVLKRSLRMLKNSIRFEGPSEIKVQNHTDQAEQPKKAE